MSSVPQTKRRLTFAEMVALGTSLSVSVNPVDQAAVDDRESKAATTKTQNPAHSHVDYKMMGGVATSSNSTVSTDGNSTSSLSTQTNNYLVESSTSNKNDVPSSVPKSTVIPVKNPWKVEQVRISSGTVTSHLFTNVHEHPTPAESIAMNPVSVDLKDSVVSNSKVKIKSKEEEDSVDLVITQEVDTSSSKEILQPSQDGRETNSDECTSSLQKKNTIKNKGEASPQVLSEELNINNVTEQGTSSPRSITQKIQHYSKLVQPQATKNHVSSKSYHTKPIHSIVKNVAKCSKNMNSHNNFRAKTNHSHNRRNNNNNQNNSSDGKTENVQNSSINKKSNKKWQDRIRATNSNKNQDKTKNSSPMKKNKGKLFTHNTNNSAATKFAAVKQIEYFFSTDELVKNVFMRKHMDVDGYLPAAIVFNFPSVLSYCVPYYDLLEALKVSKMVEVDFENECLRVKGGEEKYKRWLFPNPDGTYGCPKWIISKGDDDDRYHACSNDHFEEKKDDGTPELMSEAR